jgi:hypothetical protein
MDWIILGISLTFILHELFYTWGEYKFFQQKPFNCSFCLSFWVTIGVFFVSLNVLVFLVPLGYRMVNKLINRL